MAEQPQVGDLTDEQRQKLIKHLEGKFRGGCPVCLTQQWTLGGIVHSLPWAGGGIVLGPVAIPMAIIVCTNCSYVAHFAALPVGLVEPPKVPDSATPSSDQSPKSPVVSPTATPLKPPGKE